MRFFSILCILLISLLFSPHVFNIEKWRPTKDSSLKSKRTIDIVGKKKMWLLPSPYCIMLLGRDKQHAIAATRRATPKIGLCELSLVNSPRLSAMIRRVDGDLLGDITTSTPSM